MTTTLIILAHPETRSFNGAWADATERAARELGHDVLRSDLCQMGFDPVEGPQHHACHGPEHPFDPLKAHEASVAANRLTADVTAEVDKIRAADRLIFHFPIWWFAPPAILKGWFDRVFVHGLLHSVDQRFDNGLCRDKSALFCVTTGSKADESAFNGKEGDISMLLWPTAYTLRYLGFEVLEPRVVHGVHGYHSGEAERNLTRRLSSVLAAQKELIREFDSLPRLRFNADSDFDRNGRLMPDRPSFSLFIRHASHKTGND